VDLETLLKELEEAAARVEPPTPVAAAPPSRSEIARENLYRRFLKTARMVSCAPTAPGPSTEISLARFSLRSLPWIGLLLLAGLCLLLYGYRLGKPGFWTDESIYAQTAREMASSGDGITPTLCGKPYLIKPVLYHWLAAVAFRALGTGEMAGRLPQAFAGLLTVLAVAAFAGHLFGKRAGFLAGASLATSPGYAVGARVAGMDILLTAGITLCLTCFFLGYREPDRRRAWFLASGLFAGIATLAKGPVGAAVPALVVLIFLIQRRELLLAISPPARWGAAAGLLAAATWYVPVWVVNGDEFTRVFWLKNNLARISEPVSDHAGPVTYYLPVFLFAFLPWSFPFALGGLRALLRVARRTPGPRDPAAELLWAWFAGPFLFYSLIATKLPGYLLPVFPAAALLVAREWDRHLSEPDAGWGRGFRIACALGAVSLPGVALAVPFLLEHRYGISPGSFWIFPAVSFVFPAVAAFSALAVRGRLRIGWWVAAGAVFVLGLVRFAILPAEPYESMREMTGRLTAMSDAGHPVALAGGHLKGTLFYTGCSVPSPRDLNDLPRPAEGQPLYCLVKDRFRPDLAAWASRGRFALRTVESRGPLSLVEVSREKPAARPGPPGSAPSPPAGGSR
jgi:4-amino-4-deoxy-L-arabinose transferase-like glycosyltransferase